MAIVYHSLSSISELESVNISTNASILISCYKLKENIEYLIKYIKKMPIDWVIIIGKKSSNIENILDLYLESESYHNDKLLDVITTSLPYHPIDDVLFEFFTISTMGNDNHTLISILDEKIPEEVALKENIDKFTSNLIYKK
ncbi:hypothetical protein HMPREF2907_03055 [Neisseria sp. HMSC055H02]|jgi:hypothetical protein|uniref:hypothetical protein n=1 Tax=Neisseria mucosa TaxID=488 RepID=UPI0008A21BA5|nr:hypothetical protein [Neisseria mucosa]OFR08253.1 hypothetical protein HMPREF2907_03055 [Neisseria sp. HMSC055H02]